jgi:hypothetical protein
MHKPKRSKQQASAVHGSGRALKHDPGAARLTKTHPTARTAHRSLGCSMENIQVDGNNQKPSCLRFDISQPSVLAM